MRVDEISPYLVVNLHMTPPTRPKPMLDSLWISYLGGEMRTYYIPLGACRSVCIIIFGILVLVNFHPKYANSSLKWGSDEIVSVQRVVT